MKPNDPFNKAPIAKTGKDIINLLLSKEKRSDDLNSAAVSGDIEIALYNIWKGLLGHGNFSINKDFFQVGGNSIKAVQLASRISKEFSINIQLTDIFLQTTISQLAVLIKELQEENKPVSLNIEAVSTRPSHIPLSFSQEGLWFVDQLEGSVQFHIPAVLSLKGNLNIEALTSALQSIVDRHEVLRTVFIEEGGQAYQSIKETSGWQLPVTDGSLYTKDSDALQYYIQELIREPFDLSKDYMIRASLISLGAQDHLLVVAMHHIAADDWSMPIIVKEVIELYAAYVEDRPAQLAPLAIQYADYAIWQRNYLQDEILDKKLSYWQEKLEDITPLQLPTDYPRPAIKGSRGASKNFIIEKQLSDQIQLLCQQQGTTLHMTLLAAFKVLLHRYSGKQDICVGTSVANRSQREAEEMIGFFVNMLALRSEVSGEAAFTELLQQVRATTTGAYEHQEVPFEKVVETVVKQRDPSHTPLFQVTFVLLNNSAVPDLRLGAVNLSILEYKHTTTQYDISFLITETASGLQGWVEYSTDLYNESTIVRMLDHFKTLLSSIVKDPQQKIGDLPMLTIEEEQQLLVEFNNTKADYPKDKTIVDLFEEQVAKTPGAIAVVFEEEQLSYQQLNERANQLAHYLRSRGVKEETLVPICIERSLEMIVGILGILKAGGAYVPIDPAYPEERISYMLEDTSATLVISSKESKSKLQTPEGVEVMELDSDWSTLNYQLLPTTNYQRVSQPHHLAYAIYTSGSTGKPKGVLIEHGSVVNFIIAQSLYFNITAEERILQFTNYCFDPSVEQIFLALFNGASLILFPEGLQLNIELFEAFLREKKISHLHATPSFLEMIAPDNYEFLKRIVAGGDLCKKELAENWRNKLAFYNKYGPTETTITATEYLVNQHNSTEKIISLPIGKPLANIQVYFLDKSMALCPVGVPGELFIAGDCLARGYLNRPDLTAEKFVKNPFSKNPESRMYRTGDMGRWLPDGNIEYMGRIDDQVKIRGYRIELGEIETALQQCDGVSQGVVLASEDSSGNKRLVGYVVAGGFFNKDYMIAQLKEYIIAQLRSRLPEYMVPALWVELERLPQTANGKIDRKALPDPDAGEMLSGQYVAPRNETEEKLVNIWQNVLEEDRIGIYDDFFALGGHSLLAIRLISAIRKEFTVEMPIGDVFDYPTIALLSTRLTNESDTTVLPAIEVQARPSHIPLSFSQERLWFIDQLEGSVQYHISEVLRLKGQLNKEALSHALQSIVDRHEVLRTVFLQDAGQAYQSIRDTNEWQLQIFDGSSYQPDSKDLTQLTQQLIQEPFDLSRDYMVRAHLVTLSDQEYVLVVVMHHIASDGWSTSIIVKEVMELYAAYVEDREPRLAQPNIQYADYAIWQKNYLQGEVLDRKLDYWKQKLGGVAPLQLPTDHQRPAVWSTHGASKEFSIDKVLSTQLQTLSQKQGTTLFMTLLAAFKVLLHRYSGQQDICVGSPIANRTQQELEGLIGFFVNTLALRSEVNSKASYIELLQQVRTNTMEAYEHQDVPFEKVVELVVKERDLSRNPLFQVMFSLENIPEISQLHLGEVELSGKGHENLTALFDLTFSFTETSNGLKGSVQYSTDLYSEATIVRMMDHFKTLLSSIVKAPEQKISELVMLTKEEEQQLLVDFNDTAVDYPKDKTIVDLFEEQAVKTPGAIAVVFEEKQLSYQQLNEKANQLAHYLRSRGVKEETLVPICIERSLEMIVGILGILKAGGAYVPIDPEYPQERINYMLEDTNAAIVMTSKESRSKIAATGIEVIEIDSDWSRLNGQLSTVNRQLSTVNPHHLAYVIYTSGSTGKPKGVMIEHGNMVDKLITESRLLKADHSIITSLTTNYIFDASLLEIFLPIILGGKIVSPSKEIIFSAERLANFLFENKVTILQGTPGFLQHLLSELKTNNNNELGKNLNQLCIGGESLTDTLVKEVNEILPHVKLNNHYGPTESTIDAIVFEGVKELDKNIIGKPIANTQIYIIDDHQKLLPKGVVGEICIGGRVLARGYLNGTELTQRKFISNPFKAGERLYKTGDQGRWTEDGNIEFIGRKDDQVKIRGNRIELGEIEAILNEHQDIEQAVVTVSEIREEKILQAYVVPKLHQAEFWPSMGEYPVYDELLYFAMTHDEKRVLRYKNAIDQLVKGKSVVEIGTGKDAILARLCVEAGARIVYAIEMGKEAFEQAKVLIKQLGYEEKIILIFGDALQVNLPEPVDICVSEIIGTIGGSEGAAVILNNAQRFLKNDGVMIPERSVTQMAAVCLPDELYNTPVFGELGNYYVDKVFEKTGHPFDIRLCIKNISKQNIISTNAIIEDLHFNIQSPEQYSNEFKIRITKNSRFDGFLCWINLYPAADQLINSLEDETSWLPVYFPLFYPGIEVAEGTTIKGNFIVTLSKNDINPDYKIKGEIIPIDGNHIDFEFDSLYDFPQTNGNPFYNKILENKNSGLKFSNNHDTMLQNLREYLSYKIPSYMIPNNFYVLNKLPLTPAGKVDRKSLSDSKGVTFLDKEYVAPRNEVEEKLVAIWQELLGVERISIHDSFFELGGHSLLAMRLVSYIERNLLISVPINVIFQFTTISDFSKYLEIQTSTIDKESKTTFELVDV